MDIVVAISDAIKILKHGRIYAGIPSKNSHEYELSPTAGLCSYLGLFLEERFGSSFSTYLNSEDVYFGLSDSNIFG